MTGATASGKVGVAFTYQITTNGTATSYGLAGSLPLGLTLNTSTGAIAGTPAASGVFTVQLTATGAGGTSLPQSFVLNMRDMDVARNKTSDDQAHWVVWPLPANVTSLAEGAPKGARLPNGAYQVSATGQVYRGPGAPANGPKHHYMFEIYALDATIDVQPTADAFETRANVFKAMQGHILGKAVYGGLFRRPE